jgi:hypothetical protein
MLDAGNTVAMIHSTPIQIADFRAVVLSANIGDMDLSSVANGPAGVSGVRAAVMCNLLCRNLARHAREFTH